MASVAHFMYDAENIIDEIENRLAASEENAIRNFLCARTIQRWFRGFITRLHVRSLLRSAICIQKNWRGFQGRIIYRARLKEKFDEMCWAYYNASAMVIQKCWRGYRTRLCTVSYHQLKSWLTFVSQQNKLLKCSVEASQSKANALEMKQREEEAKEWIVYILFKLHHLLRTHQLSGIYSLPNTTDLSEIEKLLKCLKYKDFMIFYNAYMKDLREAKAKELPPFILQNVNLCSAHLPRPFAFPFLLDLAKIQQDIHGTNTHLSLGVHSTECKYPAHFEREFYEHKKPHKDFLFSRGSYHTLPQTPPNIELREKRRFSACGKP